MTNDISIGRANVETPVALSQPPAEVVSARDFVPENLEVRKGILAFQEMLEQAPDHVDPPVEHFFAPGMYGRQIYMRAGLMVVGKIHKHAHINIVSKGRCQIITETGSYEIVAPCTFISDPGTKRVVRVLEDTIWTTIHATESTDLVQIESQIIAKDYAEIEALTSTGVLP